MTEDTSALQKLGKSESGRKPEEILGKYHFEFRKKQWYMATKINDRYSEVSSTLTSGIFSHIQEDGICPPLQLQHNFLGGK